LDKASGVIIEPIPGPKRNQLIVKEKFTEVMHDTYQLSSAATVASEQRTAPSWQPTGLVEKRLRLHLRLGIDFDWPQLQRSGSLTFAYYTHPQHNEIRERQLEI